MTRKADDNLIVLNGSGFWIIFRRQRYGPFDYEWSNDLQGIEFTYQQQKFGEVCSRDEFYADLKPWRLPMTVCRAAAVTSAMIASSIADGLTVPERIETLKSLLTRHDLGRFQVRLNP